MLAGLALSPLLVPSMAGAQDRARVAGARILVRDGRVWMQARFGTRGPFPFVIDTGNFANMIRREHARALGLRQVGQVTSRGIGGTAAFPVYAGEDVSFGNARVGTLDFAAYDDLAIHREAAGLLSASVMTVADSDLDFEAGEWRIYPDGRGARPGYEMLPSALGVSARRFGAAPIFVDAAIGGRSYRLQVDTGAPGQVLLFSAATRRSGLWDGNGPYSPRQSRGIGGEGAMGRLVRVPEIGIGSIRFERALVALTDPGSRNALDADGLLGLELLERMNISTDLRAMKLWAMRNARPARPERYGISGLWIDRRGERLVVVAVSPHSPAADAGLRIGDEIQGVPFDQFIRRLGGRPGDVIDIAYRRGGEARSTRLTLRPFL